MPGTPKQDRFMRAIAHGWTPDRVDAPSRAVAKKWTEDSMDYNPKSSALTRIRGYAHAGMVGRVKKKSEELSKSAGSAPPEQEAGESEEEAVLRGLAGYADKEGEHSNAAIKPLSPEKDDESSESDDKRKMRYLLESNKG